MHNNRSHRVSYFRSASYRSVALSSTSLLLAMFSARRPTYHHVFIDGLFFLYLRIMRQICISAMRSICRAQFAPLGRMGGTINGEIIQEGAITQNYVGKCILWIIKSYFPNAIRISWIGEFQFKVEIDFLSSRSPLLILAFSTFSI